MQRATEVDIVVFGGGIAGCWTLNRLVQAGYNAILLESQQLGSAQTRHAQGIIHGGTKYALNGIINDSAQQIAAMPQRWKECLQGSGEIDLRSATILSDHQYLWSTAGIGSRISGFFASKLMRSRMQRLPTDQYPLEFQHPQFRGEVYALQEPVLDTRSVLQALTQPMQQRVLQQQTQALQQTAEGWQVTTNDLILSARKLVFCAGKGNQQLLNLAEQSEPTMQLRPLQMVVARGGAVRMGLYAHCLGVSASPRLTITSHPGTNGEPVWYLGGNLSEQGVERTKEQQIEAARAELHDVLPWIDTTTMQFSTLHIDRAEMAMEDGRRPENSTVTNHNNIICAWPTKLALTPRMADMVMQTVADITPANTVVELNTTTATLAPYPWSEAATWS